MTPSRSAATAAHRRRRRVAIIPRPFLLFLLLLLIVVSSVSEGPPGTVDDVETIGEVAAAPSCDDDDADGSCAAADDEDEASRRAVSDEPSSSRSTDGEDGDDTSRRDIRTPWQFTSAFDALGTSWSHVLRTYREVVSSADGGADRKGDVFASTLEEGLKALRSMVESSAAAGSSGGDDDETTTGGGKGSWSFETTPFDEFGATLDDLLMAFLRWSAADSTADGAEGDNPCPGECRGGRNRGTGLDDDVNNDDGGSINVSKAYRRLTAYVKWMGSLPSTTFDPPLTASSVKAASDAFAMQVTLDACGRVAWWLDLHETDLSAVRKLESGDTLRLFAWLSHFLLFSVPAQTHGIVFVDDMDRMGFWSYMTMLPVQLGMQIDRFMISVIPLKTKLVVFLNQPLWADVGYGMLGLFLPKRMKDRVVMIRGGGKGGREDNDAGNGNNRVADEDVDTDVKDLRRKSWRRRTETATREVAKVVGGMDRIPTGFGGLGGTLGTDLIAETDQGSVEGVRSSDAERTVTKELR